jgi:hypothetical protein
VLIEDLEEGYEFIRGRGPLTRNVKMCFSFGSGGDRRKGQAVNNTSAGATNVSPIHEFSGSLRMQVDQADQIRYVSSDSYRTFD